MFELLLNTVKLVVSEDGRATANALVDLLTQSPEWAKEICSIEARIPFDERERAALLCDLVSEKLSPLSYSLDCVRRFRTTFRELTENAFEHGTRPDKNDVIRLVIDVSPTYVATTVFNPKAIPTDLTSWVERGAKQLTDAKKQRRGRGLLITYEHSDVLESVASNGVKAVIYRDSVLLETELVETNGVPPVTIVFVVRGHSNPSLGRRLIELIKDLLDLQSLTRVARRTLERKLRRRPVVVCLDREALREGKKTRKRKPRRQVEEVEDVPSAFLEPILEFADEWDEHATIVLVKNDKFFKSLMPQGMVHQTIDEALEAVKSS